MKNLLYKRRVWIVAVFAIAWIVVEEAEKYSGRPGGWLSVVVAFILPFLGPGIVLKELFIDKTTEGRIATWAVSYLVPAEEFNSEQPPPQPNFHDEEQAWAALPWRDDTADGTPPGCGSSECDPDRQGTVGLSETADIFFLTPTTFYDRKAWNSPFNDSFANYLQDEAILPQQAQIFNSAGRVFAPRFRQMSGFGYFATDDVSREAAMDLAYSDVKQAFEHYLKHWNSGRPIILAGHSQGAEHGTRLLKDFFQSPASLRKLLVTAYLIGIPLYRDVLSDFAVCETFDQINCVVSFQTYSKNSNPSNFQFEPAQRELRTENKSPSNKICVNPLSWTLDETYSDAVHNEGSMHIIQWYQNYQFLFGRKGEDFRERQNYRVRSSILPLREGLTGAQCIQGALFVDALPFSEVGSSPVYTLFPVWYVASFPGGNLHPMDYNFFWANLRKNGKKRVESWYKYHE